MKKKVWTLIVAALIAVTASLIAGGVFALETGDEYSGDDLSAQDKAFDAHWSFNPETGHLSITGTGPMASRAVSDSSLATRPWHKYASQITSVSVGEGITSIGGSAFAKFTNLTDVEIADTVTYIGHWAFSGCTKLTDVVLPEGVATLSNDVFNGCGKLTSIVIPESMNLIHPGTFSACYLLKDVYIKSPKIAKALVDTTACGSMTYFYGITNVYFKDTIFEVPEYIARKFPYTFKAVHDGVSYVAHSLKNPIPDTLEGYIQFRPGDGVYDVRVLVEGRSDFMRGYTSATVTLTFTKKDDPGKTKIMFETADKAYRTVVACGQPKTARDGYGFIGLVITGIGNADVGTISASVTLTTSDGDTVTYELGSVDNVPDYVGHPIA